MRRMRWLILVVFVGATTARLPLAAADTESTVTCKDGTTSKGGKGACSHHGGVAAGASAAPAPSSAPAAKPSSPAPVPAPAPAVKCKDGSESKGGKGACSHHGGVAAGDTGESAPGAGAQPPPSTQGRSAPAAPRPSSPAAPAQPGQPTAKCKDGTMSYSAHHSGACSHHGGVTQWLQSP